ncbi:MAG: hypothetical protein EKK61_03105 [Rickettsiales bacterium]|nr:MAG: hypothetical protein EKK61_03105 [Rickettsiales bacterium]
MMMKITKQHLINLIKEIDGNIDGLLTKINNQGKIINDLKSQNENLRLNNQKTLDQIKEYIKELEQIRSHYVNSNNNNQ